jgi:hypothetical protein
MPNWDDPRGRPGPFRGEWERQAWRREAEGRLPEPRPFDDPGRGRYAGRAMREDDYRRDRDAGAAGYRGAPRGEREDTRRFGGEPSAYRGQEYGVEGHGRGSGGGFDRGGPRRQGFDYDDPGVGQGAAGYSPEAQGHEAHEHDPDYLRWRDEQMRGHDRDYSEWRRHQQAQYDDQYKQFRTDRREHFGRTFHQWRSQRNTTGGVEDISVAPGVSGYGDKSAIPGRYAGSFGAPHPDGQLDEPAHVSGDPAMTQTGGHPASGGEGQPRSASPGSEFGKEPPQVQAAADGDRDKTRKDEGRRDEGTPRH